ncbi:MAG: hypothetical protein K2M87_06675 [Muribaculaceae bacterium]|nr:hypothetical protein [Muribaculaceae bacterium]
MKLNLFKGIVALIMLFAFSLASFAEDVKTSNGTVIGTCNIESSEVKYDRSGKEIVWVKVKVKNTTGNRIRGTVYGNNGGKYEFIVDPYDTAYGYLQDCHEQPSYLICDNAK